MNYDEYQIANNYNKGRKIPIETIQLWKDKIVSIIPKDEINVIADLGCGTGRFLVAFTERYNAKVFGFEPSEKMLSEAKRNIKLDNVILQFGSALNIPLDSNETDLLFLSMVYHHIDDKIGAINEFHSVLRH